MVRQQMVDPEYAGEHYDERRERSELTIVDRCPICRVTRNCDPTGCIKCYLAGRVR